MPAFVNLGNGFTFTVCANIARSLVIKQKTDLLPKRGFILAYNTGGGIAMNITRLVNNLGLPQTNVIILVINKASEVVCCYAGHRRYRRLPLSSYAALLRRKSLNTNINVNNLNSDNTFSQ